MNSDKKVGSYIEGMRLKREDSVRKLCRSERVTNFQKIYKTTIKVNPGKRLTYSETIALKPKVVQKYTSIATINHFTGVGYVCVKNWDANKLTAPVSSDTSSILSESIINDYERAKMNFTATSYGPVTFNKPVTSHVLSTGTVSIISDSSDIVPESDRNRIKDRLNVSNATYYVSTTKKVRTVSNTSSLVSESSSNHYARSNMNEPANSYHTLVKATPPATNYNSSKVNLPITEFTSAKILESEKNHTEAKLNAQINSNYSSSAMNVRSKSPNSPKSVYQFSRSNLNGLSTIYKGSVEVSRASAKLFELEKNHTEAKLNVPFNSNYSSSAMNVLSRSDNSSESVYHFTRSNLNGLCTSYNTSVKVTRPETSHSSAMLNLPIAACISDTVSESDTINDGAKLNVSEITYPASSTMTLRKTTSHTSSIMSESFSNHHTSNKLNGLTTSYCSSVKQPSTSPYKPTKVSLGITNYNSATVSDSVNQFPTDKLNVLTSNYHALSTLAVHATSHTLYKISEPFSKQCNGSNMNGKATSHTSSIRSESFSNYHTSSTLNGPIRSYKSAKEPLGTTNYSSATVSDSVNHFPTDKLNVLTTDYHSSSTLAVQSTSHTSSKVSEHFSKQSNGGNMYGKATSYNRIPVKVTVPETSRYSSATIILPTNDYASTESVTNNYTRSKLNAPTTSYNTSGSMTVPANNFYNTSVTNNLTNRQKKNLWN